MRGFRVQNNTKQGFTLIELSIVLVIIGLIVGGVLVGQDLIRAAGVRAQITQIEKYNQAVNTFRGKYDALPGDLNAQVASNFGFTPRGAFPGWGDGDGIIRGNSATVLPSGINFGNGEQVMFWQDLTTANGLNVNLIEGSFSPSWGPSPGISSGFDAYLPQAKIGNGNYVYVWSGGPLEAWGAGGDIATNNGTNYFGVAAVWYMNSGGWASYGNPGMTVQQAYSIDQKIDDGFPQSGHVLALYINPNVNVGATWAGTGQGGAPYTTPTTGSSATCFDNGGGSGPQQYSIEISGGSNVNCALSFQFQ
jgi:prepilin-type N-terminal cleavage/methylation domain-containing protein